MEKHTAILLFTGTPKEEVKRKNLYGSAYLKGDVSIAQELISRTIRTIRKTHLPCVILSSDEQKGNSFGERLTNAIEETFLRGFDKVIAIGNDAPQLSAGLLLKAADVLQQNDCVMGPDKRGGVYLLGISKENFDAEKLLGIHWKTGSVYNELNALITECELNCSVLPVLKDVNDLKDLKAILSDKVFSFSFLHTITCILAGVFKIEFEGFLFFLKPFRHPNLYRRGPPATVRYTLPV